MSQSATPECANEEPYQGETSELRRQEMDDIPLKKWKVYDRREDQSHISHVFECRVYDLKKNVCELMGIEYRKLSLFLGEVQFIGDLADFDFDEDVVLRKVESRNQVIEYQLVLTAMELKSEIDPEEIRRLQGKYSTSLCAIFYNVFPYSNNFHHPHSR